MHADRPRLRGGHRRPDLHRQPDGGRQAAGAAARAAHHLPGAERHQPTPARGHRWHRRSTSSSSQARTPFFYLMVALALLFGLLLVIPIGAADMPVVIALLNSYARPGRRGHGLRADEQDPDHHRLARRHLGLPAVAAHVPGHEPLGDERALRRLRQGRPRRTATAPARPRAPCAASRPRRRRCSSRPRASVIIVPGYGMAVAQAQHAVAELAKHPA